MDREEQETTSGSLLFYDGRIGAQALVCQLHVALFGKESGLPGAIPSEAVQLAVPYIEIHL